MPSVLDKFLNIFRSPEARVAQAGKKLKRLRSPRHRAQARRELKKFVDKSAKVAAKRMGMTMSKFKAEMRRRSRRAAHARAR